MKIDYANTDMVEGYLDGFRATEADFPDRLANRGESYRHGWLNGRDDRLGSPRSSAADLSEKADEAIKKDTMP